MKKIKIFAAIAAMLVVNNVFAQYTIYGAKTGKYDAVIVENPKDSTSYTFVKGSPNAPFHMDRAFSVGVSAGYESDESITIGAEVAYLWNKHTETVLLGSYGFDSEEWAGTLLQRFYTAPSNNHNWTGYIGAGVQFRDRRYAFNASDEVSAEALSMGYYVADDNNHQIIISPMVEIGAKYRFAKNCAIQFSAYCGYECNEACESFEAFKTINGNVYTMTVPTTANNRGFFGGVKVSLRVAFQNGSKAPTINY